MNYYMRLKEPERKVLPLSEVADWRWEGKLADPDAPVEIADRHEVHVAKLSWGRTPCFQATPSGMPYSREEEDGFYEILSVADIRGYMATGDYEIVDEEGEVLGWDGFEERVLGWERHMREHGFAGELRDDTDGRPGLGGYLDPEGHRFLRARFS